MNVHWRDNYSAQTKAFKERAHAFRKTLERLEDTRVTWELAEADSEGEVSARDEHLRLETEVQGLYFDLLWRVEQLTAEGTAEHLHRILDLPK